jgi:hypothetical protein
VTQIFRFTQKAGYIETHSRDFSALSFRIKGESHFFGKEEERWIGKGAVLLVPAGISYARQCVEDEEIIVFHFSSLEMIGGSRALTYMDVSDALKDMGASVNTEATAAGAADWDKTTRLTSYKYVRFPYAEGERWGDDLFVLGQKVTASGAVTGAGITGSVNYDKDARILTLTGATLDLDKYDMEGTENNFVAGLYAQGELTVNLVGKNRIYSSTGQYGSDKEYVYGIHSFGMKPVTLAGSGSLTIDLSTDAAGIQQFIGVDAQPLTVDKAALTVSLTGSGESTGVDVGFRGYTLKNGAAVKVSAAGEKSTALYDISYRKSEISKDSSLELTAGGTSMDYIDLADSVRSLEHS